MVGEGLLESLGLAMFCGAFLGTPVTQDPPMPRVGGDILGGVVKGSINEGRQGKPPYQCQP